jgi:hypothetical protein
MSCVTDSLPPKDVNTAVEHDTTQDTPLETVRIDSLCVVADCDDDDE